MRAFFIFLASIMAIVFIFMFGISVLIVGTYSKLQPGNLINSLEQNGVIQSLYSEYLPGLIENADIRPINFRQLSIDLSSTEQRKALTAFMQQTLPADRVPVAIREIIAQAQAINEDSPISHSAEIRAMFQRLPDAYVSNARDLQISEQVSRNLSDLFASDETFLTAFEQIGLVLDENRTRTFFTQEVFPTSWVDAQVLDALRTYAEYASSTTDEFRFTFSVAERFEYIKPYLRSEIDRAAMSGDLRSTTVLEPIVRNFIDATGFDVSNSTSLEDALDNSLQEAGLEEWIQEQNYTITDAFIDDLAGRADPQITIDFSENREATISALSNLVKVLVLDVLEDIPDCETELMAQSTFNLEDFQSGFFSLPECVPTANQLSAILLPGSSDIPVLGGLLPLFIPPSTDVRIFISEAASSQTESVVAGFLPERVSIPWRIVLENLTDEDRRSLDEAREASQATDIDSSMLGVLEEVALLARGEDSNFFLLELFEFILVALPRLATGGYFLLAISAALLAAVAFAGGDTLRRRVIWMGAVLVLASGLSLLWVVPARFGLYNVNSEGVVTYDTSTVVGVLSDVVLFLGDSFNRVIEDIFEWPFIIFTLSTVLGLLSTLVGLFWIKDHNEYGDGGY